MNESRNISGQAYALTVLLPIVPGRESALARRLGSLERGTASPMAHVPGTHFARWVIIEDVVYAGEGQQRDRLARARLLFTSNFDGRLEPYLDGLRTGLGPAGEEIWGHCEGYPGAAAADAFSAYMRAHQIESSMFFAAYGARTVSEVTGSLAARRAVVEFALGAQGLPADELQRRFLETFA